jgi:DNA-repair protein complementing XP-A cells
VEEFAFEKWGGSEGLDKEWERREGEKKERKDKEFRRRTMEARKRTRTSLWQSRQQELQQSRLLVMQRAVKTTVNRPENKNV